MLQFLEQTGYSVIFDRSYPSEFVYSQIYNRKTDFDLLAQIDKRYAQLGTHIFIFFRTNYDKVKDEIIENDKLLPISNKYKDFVKFTKCKVDLINVDGENLNEEIRQIINCIIDK